jgi:hypothetical protein
MDFIKNPFVAIFPPFAAGILMSVLYQINISFLIFLLPIILFFIIAIHKKIINKNPHIFGLVFYLFLFLLGIYVADFNRQTMPEMPLAEQRVYQGIIIDPPKEKPNSIQCIVEIETVLDSAGWDNLSAKTVVFFKKILFLEL